MPLSKVVWDKPILIEKIKVCNHFLIRYTEGTEKEWTTPKTADVIRQAFLSIITTARGRATVPFLFLDIHRQKILCIYSKNAFLNAIKV